MQLKRARAIAVVVALFAFMLLAARARAQAPPPEMQPRPAPTIEARPASASSEYDVRASSEVATYGDTDHVFVFTPTVAGHVEKPAAGWKIDGRYLVDVVSAASVDIVSTASRRWEEVRHAGTLSAAYKPSTFGVSADAAVSSEPDYLSWTAGGAIVQDLAQKNLTLMVGFDHSHDIAGRSGTPFSVFSRPLERNALRAGLTFVIDRATIASVVADAMLENGDPSKPYRYVPMFAPGTDVPRGASADDVARLRLTARPLEQLPLTRQRWALTLHGAHRWSASTLRLDERLYTDSWDLHASTTDARWLFDVTERFALGPHARIHAQTPVSFWQRAYELRPGFDFPALRTGDRELGPLINLTGGGSLRWSLGPIARPSAFVLGFDLNVTSTQYLDDLYLTHRLSALGALSLEAEL